MECRQWLLNLFNDPKKIQIKSWNQTNPTQKNSFMPSVSAELKIHEKNK